MNAKQRNDASYKRIEERKQKRNSHAFGGLGNEEFLIHIAQVPIRLERPLTWQSFGIAQLDIHLLALANHHTNTTEEKHKASELCTGREIWEGSRTQGIRDSAVLTC